MTTYLVPSSRTRNGRRRSSPRLQRLGGSGIKSPANMCIPARLASCADFLQRGKEVLGLPPDLPLLPADLPYVLSEATRHLGPRLEPLAAWVADPAAIPHGDSTHTKHLASSTGGGIGGMR